MVSVRGMISGMETAKNQAEAEEHKVKVTQK
jgi:hypothetical protein